MLFRSQVRSAPTQTGYRVQALVPLALLKVDPRAAECLLEFQVTSVQSVAAGGALTVKRGMAFGSRLAYLESSRYGRFRLGE